MKSTNFLLMVCSISCGTVFCTGAFAQATIDPHGVCAPDPVVNPVYQPITGRQRVVWVVDSTVGLENLAFGTVDAAIATWNNQPSEYGTHWDGYGKRYVLRLSGIVTSNVMEAGIGALWSEDPRYVRASAALPFKSRVVHVVKWTFMAPRRDGNLRPAYARYIAYTGSNFLSNTWRPPSDASVGDALNRTGQAFLGEIGSNAFNEFWPDFRRLLFRCKPRH